MHLIYFVISVTEGKLMWFSYSFFFFNIDSRFLFFSLGQDRYSLAVKCDF